MSGGDGNRTVFKPSPLQALNDGGPAPQLKTKPRRPVKALASPAPASPPSQSSSAATDPTMRPTFKPDTTRATEQTRRPQPVAPAPSAPPRAGGKGQAGRGGSFWLSLAVAAALAAVILYFIFRYSGLA